MSWVKIFESRESMEKILTLYRPKILIVNGKRICLVRTKDRLIVFDDHCPHLSESLSKGIVNYMGEIVCPWHGYRFELNTGRECAQRSRDLNIYLIKGDSDGMYLQF